MKCLRAHTTDLRHLWPRRDIQLSAKGWVYAAAMRSILLHCSETWLLKVDVQRLSVLEHRYLRGIGEIWRENYLGNSEVRCEALGLRIQYFNQNSN